VPQSRNTDGRHHHQIVDPIKQSPAGTIELAFAPHLRGGLRPAFQTTMDDSFGRSGISAYVSLLERFVSSHPSFVLCPWKMAVRDIGNERASRPTR
jgi:hypothetical protein